MTLPPMILVAGSVRVADCSRARQRTRSAPNTTAGGLRPGPPSAQTRDRQADFPHLYGASPRSGFVSPICNLSSAIWHLPGGVCHLASAAICQPPSRAGHPPSIACDQTLRRAILLRRRKPKMQPRTWPAVARKHENLSIDRRWSNSASRDPPSPPEAQNATADPDRSPRWSCPR